MYELQAAPSRNLCKRSTLIALQFSGLSTKPEVDLSEVEVANFRAATLGACSLVACRPGESTQPCVSWLQNGPDGTTLPEELISKGYHVSQRAFLPGWLEQRAILDGRLESEDMECSSSTRRL